ncbi:protein 5NUC-like isoform X2 [Photinus pyralis]|uniref:5'-Nucleotidase C-terminal domain-containing protein n=1 Tax=Photinus pyralis TaxID=7054 RepID=A0A1Y1LV81_PHOPY|nr:protein 5NUC-like isoform X2 [Photinus pyralis]
MKVISFGILLVINLFLRSVQCENLKLLILHNNDMHSRFEETSRTSGTCKDKSNCYGGFGRVLHVVREARKAAADGTGPPVLFLNAGDTYTGTSWFSVHKWRIAADFMNLLQPDVASFGNHEFDDRPEGIVPFLKAINFPVVAANLNFSKEPLYLTTNVTKSHTLVVSGRKIGVIGYVLPQTATISSPGNVDFGEEVDALRAESERLNGEGVKIIVALGHSGFDKDKEIAENVPLVDLVIGGHTNTFLWNGPQPDWEAVEGPYPTIVTQSSGKKVPVVQAYAYTKYMGRLNVIFDDNGDLVEYNGQPQLLNSTVRQEKQALVLLEKYRPEVEAINNKIVGTTRVRLDGEIENCRVKECNLANLVADALVEHHAHIQQGRFWTDAPIALFNAGSIRTDIVPKFPNGSFTMGEIMQAFPYSDQLHFLSLNGSDLLETLEIGARYNGDTNRGELIHASGIRYTFDMSKPVGSRIVSARARCGSCDIPKYSTIKEDHPYRIITTDFVVKGGDGHHVIRDKSYDRYAYDYNAVETIAWYTSRHSPIIKEEDERLIALNSTSWSSSMKGSATYLALTAIGLTLVR